MDINTTTEEKEITTPVIEEGRYKEAVGRRKTATARVRVSSSAKQKIVVNGKDFTEYFATEELHRIIQEPFIKSKLAPKFSVSAVVKSGGIHAQAEAIRHGISRILAVFDEEIRTKLKKSGFLKRDARMKERRKFGLKKARKAPQWSKR